VDPFHKSGAEFLREIKSEETYEFVKIVFEDTPGQIHAPLLSLKGEKEHAERWPVQKKDKGHKISL
jgi:hypothetical protein